MIRTVQIRGFILITLLTCVAQAHADAPTPRLGINLAGPADWNTELPFVDVFRMSRPWISQRKAQAWGRGPVLKKDQHGWVKKLEPDCWAETPLCTIEGNHYPSGRYNVYYQGEGTLSFAGAARAVTRKPGHIVIDVDAAKGPIWLRLMKTNPSNYIRNIRVVMPGFEKTYQKQPFHPAFLKRWQGVACFRFMDWMHTNGSEVKTWSDRPKPTDATYAKKGIALECMIDLCNQHKADAWFCMPHEADDDYIRSFATMVKQKLNPTLHVYIEYSNEVWNGIFAQHQYAQQQAKVLGLGNQKRPWEGAGMYYAQRSVEIFKIWEKVYGGRNNLVRVLAWQAGNTWWMENIVLTHNDAYKQADALGIAPYMGMNIPREGKKLTAEEVAQWSVDQVLDHLEKVSLPRSIEAIRKSKQIADKYQLKLIAYEGGQHMVGVAGGENNQKLTKLLIATNQDPRIGRIYQKYLAAWENQGGDLFAYFSSVGKWSKWGSWGAMQYYDEDPATTPKMKAIIDWAHSKGQAVR
ncbi:MAG: hypothetical protein KJO79_03410 [Verrucomicrobiae bacterium]|nr:hypothetical protein [Verrucomicrobiae bacterium]NNJ86204.1 hypothetical protein [Akkermansiaceae bacterium]